MELNYQIKIKIMKKITGIVKVRFEENMYLAEASSEFRKELLVSKGITDDEISEIIIEELTRSFNLKGDVIELTYNKSVGFAMIKLKDGGSIKYLGSKTRDILSAIEGENFWMIPFDIDDKVGFYFEVQDNMTKEWSRLLELRVIRLLANKHGLIPVNIIDRHKLGFNIEYSKKDLIRAADSLKDEAFYLSLNLEIRKGILCAERELNKSYNIDKNINKNTIIDF